MPYYLRTVQLFRMVGFTPAAPCLKAGSIHLQRVWQQLDGMISVDLHLKACHSHRCSKTAMNHGGRRRPFTYFVK
ncbi:hypothetical protein C8Q74DRAFT_639691 [Fomes fomentarius]|nr:hypothetical protein C8Q74DRAFT_639691 [Fomes fomentarius]